MGTPVRSPARRRLRGDVPPSQLRLPDLGSEALAGLLQRPGRSALTLIGVMLGIGSFVTIVGIAQTASGQIGKQFNVLQATQAYVFDVGAAAQSGTPAVDFPPNADALADRIHGVVAAGVYWAVHFKQAAVSAYASGFLASQRALPVTAASPGLLTRPGRSWSAAPCSTSSTKRTRRTSRSSARAPPPAWASPASRASPPSSSTASRSR